jgi:hypothetical protein
LYGARVPAFEPPKVNAADIFLKAQTVWNERAVPSFESFELPCEQTLLADRCAAGTIVQFVVRMSDGRAFAQTIGANGEPATVLLRGGEIEGPAGAPFGFFRRTPSPGAALVAAKVPAQADPIGTSASVTAVDRAYDIALRGTQTIDGRVCYDLTLRPLRDPAFYPLRELFVERSSGIVVALTYDQPFNATFAHVHYRFAPVGPQQIWSIVHIDAEATTRGLFSARTERVDQDLQNITFPTDVPSSDFSQ